MNLRKLILSGLAICIAIQLTSQEFEVPENYQLNEKEDYVKYEEDVLRAIDWIYATPIHSDKEKEKAVHGFIIKWITGSPSVSVDVKPEVVTFIETNPELMLIFMYGWTKYAIETKDNSKLKGSLSGIEAAIDFYTKNLKELEKDKNVEKYIKMKEKGSLEEYLEKKV
jgi:hypothetical protein